MNKEEEILPRRKRNLPLQDRIEIGKRIRKRRKAQNMNLRELAERSHISTNYLSRIENGNGSLSLAVLKDIVTALGARYAYILDGTLTSSNDIPDSTMKLLAECDAEDYEYINRMISYHLEFLKKAKLKGFKSEHPHN